MIESSPFAWLSLILLVLMASLMCIALSRYMPWSNSAREHQLDTAFGIVLAPFLAGMASVLVLVFFPVAPHLAHKLVVSGFFGIGTLAFFNVKKKACTSIITPRLGVHSLGEYLLQLMLVIWVIFLLINSVFIPLTQNDSLEYATVGRELFLSRSLGVYPLLNPNTNASGFFAPWTHPPLYVSLVYLMSILQGHADEPGLMRLISPWFLLSATYGIVMLGRLQSRNVGWFSGILLLSVPLLFLGADSALIDPLVASGTVLLMIALVGFWPLHARYPFALGGVLGLILWTHSQSILFIPLIFVTLCVQQGLKHWRKISRTLFITLAVALLVGGLPYVRNYFLFGLLIHDNPLVFAMPELDWQGYFSYARGLNHWVAIVQYGILKGWFSLEAYGLLFWLWTGGAILLLVRLGTVTLKQTLWQGLDDKKRDPSWLLLPLVLAVTYLGGVILSIIMGIDLMIRNERYMLLIVPALALGAAYFLEALAAAMWQRVLSSTLQPRGKDVMFAIYWVLACIFLLQAVAVGWLYRWCSVEEKPKKTAFSEALTVEEGADFSRFDWINNRWSSFNVIRRMREMIPEDALVLTMRPADMYYGKRRMVSYLDPRLLPFYRERDPPTAIDMLKVLGIRYVFMTDYSLPPAYNSSLLNILADPGLSRLIYCKGMTQLYELTGSGQIFGDSLDITPGNHPWTRIVQMRIGGRKALNAISAKPEFFERPTSVSSMSFFQRDYSVVLASGHGSSLSSGIKKTYIPVGPGEYVVRMKLAGEGYLVFWLSQFDDNGTPVIHSTLDYNSPLRMGDLSLSDKNSRLQFTRRFRLEPKTRYIRIGIEHVGRSHVTIENISLERLIPAG